MGVCPFEYLCVCARLYACVCAYSGCPSLRVCLKFAVCMFMCGSGVRVLCWVIVPYLRVFVGAIIYICPRVQYMDRVVERKW